MESRSAGKLSEIFFTMLLNIYDEIESNGLHESNGGLMKLQGDKYKCGLDTELLAFNIEKPNEHVMKCKTSNIDG